jgi:hypothetical protein
MEQMLADSEAKNAPLRQQDCRTIGALLRSNPTAQEHKASFVLVTVRRI